MSRIDKLIEELCPNGVEFKELGEVCEFKRGQSITKKNIQGGNIPVIAGGKNPAYFHNISNRGGQTISVSGSGANAGYVGFWEIPIFLSDAFSVEPKNEDLENKFVYYFLISKQELIYNMKSSGGIPHVYGKNLAKIKIPLPPLPIQKEIVNMLDQFTELEENLTKELEKRKKQYEYYREELLKFDEEDVEWRELKYLADIGTGSSNTNEGLENGKYPFFVRSQIMRFKNSFEFDEIAIITSGDGVGVGKIFHYVEGKYALHQRAYRICFNKGKPIIPKFFFNYMKNTFEKYILGNSVHSSVTSIRKPKLEKYLVPLPPLEIQQQIVEKLDKFDELVNEVLPKEIELRRKQYEFYREKLLTFEELKNE